MDGELDVNFLAVVSLQLAALIFFYFRLKPVYSFWSILFVGMAVAVPYGAFVDLFVGFNHGVFNYQGRETSIFFLFSNWIFSYGFFVATVFCLPKPTIQERRSAIISLLSILFLLSITYFNLSSVENLLLKMLLLGGLLVAVSELFACVAGEGSYIKQTIYLQTGAIHFWIFCIATGAFYELSNLLFPLWHWENRQPSVFLNYFLIVLFGYWALVYPIFTIRLLWERRF